jgi:sugar phosphate isomerase/epimerase
MNVALNRRSFIQAAGAAGAGLGLAALNSAEAAQKVASATPHADKLGWRLSNTCYTFNSLSFFEAVEKTAGLGIRYVEGFSWQPVSRDKDEGQMNETMPTAQRAKVKQRLGDLGVKLRGCYLAELPNDEAAARKKFDWGKDLGINYFVAEPAPVAMDLVERLCDEYKMSLAIHNHPKPSSVYWNPQKVVEVTKGRTKRIGACCDTGHWVRSGLQPVDCLKLLEGRIISFHLKDVKPFGKVDAEEVPWGTGKSDIAAILKEVRRQGIKPVIAIEYERQGDTLPELRQCLAFYEKTAAELGG